MRSLLACSILAVGLAWAQHSIAGPLDSLTQQDWNNVARNLSDGISQRHNDAAPTAVAAPSTGNDMKSVSLGGVGAMCGSKKSAAADEKSIADYAGENDLKPVDISKDDAKKLIDALNATKPITTMKFDRLIVYRNDDIAFMLVINGGRLCALHPMPRKIFDALSDQAFGAGS